MMAADAASDAVRGYASRIRHLRATLWNAVVLPKPPTFLSRGNLELPTLCTRGVNTVCGLLKCLPALNDILYFMAAEATEVAPGELAIHLWEGLLLEYDEYGLNQEYAAIFLHCLLTRHRCVKSVEFSHPPRGEMGFELLVCDALTATRSVTCLSLRVCELNVEATSVAITAIYRLLTTTLLELSFDTVQLAVRTGESLHGLAQRLAQTSTLKVLKVYGVSVVCEAPCDAEDIDFTGMTLRALATNTSISTLIVGASFCTHKDGSSFKKMLALPSAPVNVTVCGYEPEYRHKANVVLEALVSNKTVNTLHIEGFSLGPSDAKSLSNIISENDTIKDIDCAKCSWNITSTETEDEEDGIRWHVKSLSKALASAKSLRRLAVHCDFTPKEMRRLLQAARDCATLRELHFPFVTLKSVMPLLRGLQEVANAQQVTVGTFSAHAGAPLVVLLRAVGEILGDKRDPPVGAPSASTKERGEDIPLCCEYIIPAVHLRAEPEDVNLEFAQALGDYLSLTRTLTCLHMEFPTPLPCSHAIIEGLCRNGSIEDLSILGFCVQKEDMDVLCDWLACSRRLYRLTLRLGDCATQLALEKLATLLNKNYTLTSLDIYDYLLDSLSGQTVKNLIRRNDGFVKCAAGFVLGSSLKRAAVGFELASRHPQLNATVQRIGCVDEGGAERMIRESSGRLRFEFWRLAGIVKAQIRCSNPQATEDTESSDKPQLDELGLYVLDHIRSFLKVGDVLDEDEAQTRAADTVSRMSRKRKRKS